MSFADVCDTRIDRQAGRLILNTHVPEIMTRKGDIPQFTTPNWFPYCGSQCSLPIWQNWEITRETNLWACMGRSGSWLSSLKLKYYRPQQGGKFHSLARSQSVEMGEGCWTAAAFISLCFLIADVMWPAASHSCHLALTTMTDCTLKLCGFSFELLLPEWCNTGAEREAKALTLQETPCVTRLWHCSSTHKSSSDCDLCAESQMLLRWSSLEKPGTDVSFHLSTFPSPSMGKGKASCASRW